MIKLRDDFDVEFDDLLDMDLKFAYILDLFNLKDMEGLVKQREEILETYLLDSNSEQEFEQKKRSVARYFDLKSLDGNVSKIMESKFDEEE